MKNENREKEPEIKKINELSKYLEKMFRFRKDCKNCWGRGIETRRYSNSSEFTYIPCFCVRAK